MEWTATAKELEASGFRIGLDKIFRDFKYMYLVIIPITGGKLLSELQRMEQQGKSEANDDIGMIYLGTYAPRGYQITDFTAIVPLANQIGCHALLPVYLSPLSQVIVVKIANIFTVRTRSSIKALLILALFICNGHSVIDSAA